LAGKIVNQQLAGICTILGPLFGLGAKKTTLRRQNSKGNSCLLQVFSG